LCEPITQLIGGLKHADEEAVAGVWNLYFGKLVRIARRKLNGAPCRIVDEEDVALNAFNSFCGRAVRGEFRKLEDRNDLWRLLVMITQRKAAAAVRDASRQKRPNRHRNEIPIEEIAATDPSPETLVSLGEQQQRLMALLPNDACRRIVQLKLDGHIDDGVAAKLDVTDRTVRRKLNLVRAVWRVELERISEEGGSSRMPADAWRHSDCV
jgi:DNA-directed RNA polymerase specialized sigma24 family protein